MSSLQACEEKEKENRSWNSFEEKTMLYCKGNDVLIYNLFIEVHLLELCGLHNFFHHIFWGGHGIWLTYSKVIEPIHMVEWFWANIGEI